MRKMKMKMVLLLQRTLASRLVHLVSPTVIREEAALLTQPQVQARTVIKKVSANVIMLGLVTQLEIAADKEVKALK
jgi:hypothetical protein